MSGAQQVEEVQPALARARAEPGEIVVADLRAKAVAPRVSRAGIVDADPGGALQPRPQHVTGFKAVFCVAHWLRLTRSLS